MPGRELEAGAGGDWLVAGWIIGTGCEAGGEVVEKEGEAQIVLQVHTDDDVEVILCGIATNYGIESTAREAFDRGFRLYFAEDAMTSGAAGLHQFSTQKLFPAMGKVRSTLQLIQALPPET